MTHENISYRVNDPYNIWNWLKQEPGWCGEQTVSLLLVRRFSWLRVGSGDNSLTRSDDIWSTLKQEVSHGGIHVVAKFQRNPQGFYLLMWPGKVIFYILNWEASQLFFSAGFYRMGANFYNIFLFISNSYHSSLFFLDFRPPRKLLFFCFTT